MIDLENKFAGELANRNERERSMRPQHEMPDRKLPVLHFHNCHSGSDSSSSSSSEEEEEDENFDIGKLWVDELDRKKNHPDRLHPELWFNEPGEMNDGPVCRCNLKAQKSGIRHNIYPGEDPFPRCDPESNNRGRLYHYRITMSPHTNFLTKNPTIVEYDDHEYIFEGFSLLSHYRLADVVPVCKVVRFNIEYTIHWFEEDGLENFSVRALNLFSDFLFKDVLEMFDLKWEEEEGDGCRRFHFMPRFARALPGKVAVEGEGEGKLVQVTAICGLQGHQHS